MVPVVLNSSCEACRASKVKCSGERTCQRCASKGFTCVYQPRKRRGKPRDKEIKYEDMISGASTPIKLPDTIDMGSPQALYADYSDNEVFSFCLNNGFPIKFINSLLRAGVTSFQLASEVTEPELMNRFGPLSYDQLLLWRTKIRETLYKNLVDGKAPLTPTYANPVKPASSIEENQCAQFLSNLKLQAQNLAPTNMLVRYPANDLQNNVNNCMFSQLYNTIIGGACKKRKVEDETYSPLLTPNTSPSIEDKIQRLSFNATPDTTQIVKPKEDIKESMAVVDWLVNFLQGLCKCDMNASSEEAQMQQCLDDVVKKIEGLNKNSQEECCNSLTNAVVKNKASGEDVQAICQLRKKTLSLIQQQFELLKSKLA